jgi:arginyl-tRNA synthetase
VTPDALARLAVRITQAGPRFCRSDALAAMAVTAPVAVDLASAPTWAQARRRLSATVLGRLAEAAGAQVTWIHATERLADASSPGHTGASQRPGHEAAASSAARSGAGPVAEAIGFAGTGPVIYALACLPPGGAMRLDARLIAAHDLGNPAYAVRYAHAHAASTLRQAADLGLGLGEAAEFQPRLLAHPSEQVLLCELSWLPERVARAARRGRLDVLARFLEGLAGAYLACQETCPAVRPGEAQDGWSSGVAMGGTPDGGPPGATARPPGEPPGSPVTVARLWLAAAARTALRAGLDLLGVDAPDRM